MKHKASAADRTRDVILIRARAAHYSSQARQDIMLLLDMLEGDERSSELLRIIAEQQARFDLLEARSAWVRDIVKAAPTQIKRHYPNVGEYPAFQEIASCVCRETPCVCSGSKNESYSYSIKLEPMDWSKVVGGMSNAVVLSNTAAPTIQELNASISNFVIALQPVVQQIGESITRTATAVNEWATKTTGLTTQELTKALEEAQTNMHKGNV